MKYEDLDDILPIVGGFGRFQKFLFCYSILFNIFLGWVYLSQVFLTTDAPHWCNVPELDNLDVDEQRRLSIPLETRDGKEVYNQCQMYNVNYTQVLAANMTPQRNWKTVYCRHGWNYDYSEYYPTIVTEYNWVCEESWRPAFAQSMFFVGAILGTLFFGWMADKWGRRPVLIVSNLLACAGGIATVFSNGFAIFVTFRFFVGMAYDLHFVMMMIIMQEYVSPEKRTLVGQLPMAIFTTLSEATVSLIAEEIFNWRIYCLVTSVPLIVVIFAKWIVPESPRWLLAKGRVEETTALMKKLAKANKNQVDDGVFQDFEKCMFTVTEENNKVASKSSILDLIRTPNLRKRTILMCPIWMVMTMVFDAHVRHIPEIDFNHYDLWALNQISGIPGNLIALVLMDRVGRRWLHTFVLCATAVLLFCMPLLNWDEPWTVIAMIMLGRFFLTVSLNGGLQYMVELLPTVLRGRGIAAIHILGHASTFFSPYLVLLMQNDRVAGYAILGAISLLGGLMCLLLPETANQRLPQTVEEGEEFGRKQAFLGCPCLEKVYAAVYTFVYRFYLHSNSEQKTTDDEKTESKAEVGMKEKIERQEKNMNNEVVTTHI